MKSILPVILLAILAIPQLTSAEGDLLLLNGTGSNLSSLNISVIPGSLNSTVFRISAANDNITNAALFYLGPLNVSIVPNNLTGLPMGDAREINVTIALDNESSAGVRQDKIIILTSKPEHLELPVFITIPETAGWSITSATNISRNVSLGEAGLLTHVFVNNSGNVEIHGRVVVVDLPNLVWMDESDFVLAPAEGIDRPVYFSVLNGTLPGIYQANISFFDSLNNARRINVTLLLGDLEGPRINITLASHSASPNGKLQVDAEILDNVNVSRAWGMLDGRQFNLSRDGDTWSSVLGNLTVGNHTVIIYANDTSGNIALAQDSFSVFPFNYITSQPFLNFYRFKSNQARSLVMMNSPQSVGVNITLINLAWTNQENNLLIVSVMGERLLPGVSRQFTLNGDMTVSIIGGNSTVFTGSLEIVLPSDVQNANPTISFGGTVGDYYVSAPLTMVVAGVRVECSPQDVGVYENSSYVCMTKYPIDTNSSELSVTIPKKSYDAMVNGYETQVSAVTDQRNSAQSMNWLLFFVILISITGIASYEFVWRRTHFKLK